MDVEFERQEYLDIWSFVEQTLVNLSRISQLRDANCISSFLVTGGVQWIEYL